MKGLPDIAKNFPDWYQEVVYSAELADQAPVRGAMVIRPYGWALWENMKAILDARIKATGHQNAAFPLFIPESFFKREAKHVEGFAPEVAVVTHAGGKQLEEPLVVRPTSETMIHFMFARWIRSWRDLPMKINQWANVVRWEMRPRAFLRTTEFFWQEGHTAHETKEEAHQEVFAMLREYVNFVEHYLAIPAIVGKKTEFEKFPGAEETYTFEALMQDGKALQMGTSHLLSQLFAQSFDMKFQDRNEGVSYPYLTSWGVTTRLIGATVMVHGDQNGLVLPPRIAPTQVVIVPILGGKQDLVLPVCNELKKQCEVAGIRVLVDESDKTPGNKYYYWELRGVPLRVEVGPRDIQNNQITVAKRLDGHKTLIDTGSAIDYIRSNLETMQTTLLERAKDRQQKMWHHSGKVAAFGPQMDAEGGFYQTGWCGQPACEQKLKEFKGTIRCVLPEKRATHCFGCDAASAYEVLAAKSY